MVGGYDPYEKYGLKRVVNAATSLTRLGGSMPHPEVFEAMEDASKAFVSIPVLQAWAGDKIAKAFGAEAGLPTASASISLTLATAACIMKDTKLENYDPLNPQTWTHLAQLLPMHTKGLKTEVVIMKNNRNNYDHAVECAGGEIIEAGSEQKVTEDDLLESYDPVRTAAYYYTLQIPKKIMPLKDFAKVAHKTGVPVMVDAAPYLSHKSIPKKMIDDGADIVIFSGGKHLGGPNNTGVLAGRSDLVKLAHLQSYPFDGIGRGAKMSRETIIGLVKALDLFMERDDEAYYRELREKSKTLSKKLDKILGISSGIIFEPTVMQGITPPSYAYIEVESGAGISLKDLYSRLLESDPVIEVLFEPFFITPEAEGKITIKAEYLILGDDEIILQRIREIMKN